MPQTLTKEWREELQPNADEVHQTWLHRIGNLTITGYNSEYSNAPFKTKKTIQDGFDSSPYRLNELIKEARTWTAQDMRRRNEALTRLALRYWPMIDTEFEPIREPLPTVPMGDDTSFTNRILVAYEFDGTTTTVKSFKDMITSVVRQLLGQHRESVYEYAADNGLGFTVGKVGLNRYQEEIAPELWATVRNPTNDKMNILRALFRHLDIDTDDLVFTLRPYHKDELEPAEESPFADLTKFAPQFAALEGTEVTAQEIAELRAEFEEAFANFHTHNWNDVVDGRTYEQLAELSSVTGLSVPEALASIQMVVVIESMAPGIFRRAVVEGSLARWLNCIAEQSVPVNPAVS